MKVIQALPDAWLLPATAGGSTLVAMDNGYWLRSSPHAACEIAPGLLPLLLQKAGEGEVCCYGETPADVDVDTVQPWCYGDAPAKVHVDVQHAWQHPLALIQPQWQTCRVTLLHGQFSAKASTGKAAKSIKAAMAAAGLLSLGLLLGPRIAMAWMLVQQENQVQQEILQVYQHHFPSIRQQTNIKYHFGQNMKKQSKGIFLQLDDLEKARQAVPGMEISLLEYDAQQNSLTLSVSSQSQTALQTFVNQAGENFDFTLQPVSTSAPYTAMIAGKYK